MLLQRGGSFDWNLWFSWELLLKKRIWKLDESKILNLKSWGPRKPDQSVKIWWKAVKDRKKRRPVCREWLKVFSFKWGIGLPKSLKFK